jgi:antitoxin (DNA-binding transcriptional repressor) of toxin-antitoxin stability system
MGEATVRQLRNEGGSVIERVLGGERVIITRDGEAVAELRPLPRRPLARDVLVERFRLLPPIDAQLLRAEVDATVDQSI